MTELSAYCIQNFVCYDLPRAKDFMRTSTCEIYEVLKKEYSSAAWHREDEVADEAAQIAIACWDNFNVYQKEKGFWVKPLRDTIIQHNGGRPLRSQRQKTADASASQSASAELEGKALPLSAYAASGVDIASGSPLLIMAAARARGALQGEQIEEAGTEQVVPDLLEAERRANLLAEYKKATGNPSNKKIYEAHNSGIYKPEFYQWKNGVLPAGSRTTRQFEAFLKARRKPIPRNPTREV